MNLLERGLPKWPALVVQGKPVSKEQAAEIIVRTTCWYDAVSSNSKGWNKSIMKLIGLPYKDNDWPHYDYDAMGVVCASLNTLDLEYLHNSRISTSYVGGPHGWCDWNGIIGCDNYNIGKWPSVTEVMNEWGVIARSFPYLDLVSQLFSGEHCEEGITPIVEFVVKDGTVQIREPSAILNVNTEIQESPSMLLDIVLGDGGRGCSQEQLEHAIALVRKS